MRYGTLTRSGLVEAVTEKVDVSKTEAAELVESVLREIADSLVEGEQVKLSSFGTFGVREKAERIGRNPKTGEEAKICRRRVLSFKPSNIMKQHVNEMNLALAKPHAAE